MRTEQIALAEVEKQLHQRGFSTTRTGRNGDIDARKGPKLGRLEVKGLALPNAVWLTERQVNAVQAVVIYVVQSADVWVLSPAQAHFLLDKYQSDFISRHGRPPAQPGFNWSELVSFLKLTGWEPLDILL
jgi:hypothetical protein